eukprot:scaffold1.g5656.t1
MDRWASAGALSQRLLPFRPLATSRPLRAAKRGLRAVVAGGAAAGGLVALAANGSLPLPPATPPLLSGLAGPGGGDLQRRPSDFGHPARRWTDALLITNLLLFGAQLASKELVTVWGIKINQLIVMGQWWRLLTPVFLHGGLAHLVVNSISLNNLGVAGTVASFLGSPAPSLGASGAIFGVGGALAVFFYRNRNLFGRRSEQVLQQLWQTLLMNVTYGLVNPRIDNWGHMGGMLGGALIAYLLGPALEVRELPGKRGKYLVDSPPIPLFVSPLRKLHLKDLLQDDARTAALIREHNGIYLDFSRQNATPETVKLLVDLANKAGLKDKVAAMFGGQHINSTEDRAVLHVALRAARGATISDAGKNVVPEVWEVLDKIKAFSDRVRSGEWKGATGKPLTNVVSIGIGGSALGPLFVHTALTTEPGAAAAAAGRKLVFLANVDPVDAVRALGDLDPETTLVVIVSKTFTTAETMLNARTARAWLVGRLGADAVAKHMVAVSTNLKAVEAFGIDPTNAFGFWDWVGGRFSVSSAVGMLPLSLQYGYEVMERFLAGMRDVDDHFASAPLEANLPALLGLLNVWNATFLSQPTTAILPYQQALQHFAPHIQQLSMESNGKGVAIDGTRLAYEAGASQGRAVAAAARLCAARSCEIDFGEPGTNGQHSFYQLIHQGRVIPAEFIGVVRSQQDVYLQGEKVSSHEELMCNFFAQPDALAVGKDAATLAAEGVPPALVPHKTFGGNRPSLSLLLPELSPFCLGQLLALYEHRVATSGFVWGINSFDQWGVELGKVLANNVRAKVEEARAANREIAPSDGFNASTRLLLNRFLATKTDRPAAGGPHSFPPGLQD